MILGKPILEKIALCKAVALRVMSHR